MKRLSVKYRAQLSDKLMDWANLVFVGVAYLLVEGGGR